MKQDQKEFLSLRHWPCVASIEEASYITGFSADEIRILVSAGLLRVLGDASANQKQQFSTSELKKLLDDPEAASTCRRAIIRHWRRKNNSRRISHAASDQNTVTASR
jgi:hypothetical protein